MSLTVRRITADQHREWIASRPSVSFLQLPQWGEVKVGWRAESVGWFDGSSLVGAGLVLYRPVPRMPQRSLAYLPEGPDIDWLGERMPGRAIEDWLRPLLAHCRTQGAFLVKMGPPVATRRWEAATVKAAIAERGDGDSTPGPDRISDVVADWHSRKATALAERLRAMGWVQEASDGAGFGDVQPRYVFQLPIAGRTPDDVLAGFNQLWRRNIKKADKSGVVVRQGDASDLPAFHAVYVETANRDHFTPRPLSYFERMMSSLNSDDPDIAARHGRLQVGEAALQRPSASREDCFSLYLAEIDGHVAASTIMVRVGNHAWYSYGASTTADREARPSNALQWQMIQDAIKAGCAVYDLRGIADTLDPNDHLYGLVQFKLGTGGLVQEYVGEWDYVLRPAWAKAYSLVQARR